MSENVEKAEVLFNKLLKKYKLEENKRYDADLKIKPLLGKEMEVASSLDFRICLNELSPALVLDYFHDNSFVGSYAFLDKDLTLDKYDKFSIEEKIDIPQNAKQYSIKLFNKKFIDSLHLKCYNEEKKEK